MNITATQNQTMGFARLLAGLADLKPKIVDLAGEAEPSDASDMADRLREVFELVATYTETEMRSLQRHIGADTARYPLCNLAPASIRGAIVETFTDFVAPVLLSAEEYLSDCAEYTDLMREHGLGKQQMGLR